MEDLSGTLMRQSTVARKQRTWHVEHLKDVCKDSRERAGPSRIRLQAPVRKHFLHVKVSRGRTSVALTINHHDLVIDGICGGHQLTF